MPGLPQLDRGKIASKPIDKITNICYNRTDKQNAYATYQPGKSVVRIRPLKGGVIVSFTHGVTNPHPLPLGGYGFMNI